MSQLTNKPFDHKYIIDFINEDNIRAKCFALSILKQEILRLSSLIFNNRMTCAQSPENKYTETRKDTVNRTINSIELSDYCAIRFAIKYLECSPSTAFNLLKFKDENEADNQEDNEHSNLTIYNFIATLLDLNQSIPDNTPEKYIKRWKKELTEKE